MAVFKPPSGFLTPVYQPDPTIEAFVQENQSLLQSFENCSRSALGTGPWMARFDGELIENLGRYRKYNQSSLRDLLRVIRNKHNHFRELPESLQEKLGPLPQGYFSCAPALSELHFDAECAAFARDQPQS